MTGRFSPHMHILPPAQQRLWPELRNAPNLGFTLYGGTAIALRLGHRASVDFDFFSEQPLNREVIKEAFPFIAQSTTLQDRSDTWTVRVPYGNSEREHVKVSFFGAITFGRVGEPDFTDDGVLLAASFDDLMATKVKVILQRAEAKDYRDVVAMLNAGVDLSRGLASARLLFGPVFQPSESLKALAYFNDGDLKTLTASERDTLVHATLAVRDLPQVALRSTSLTVDMALEAPRNFHALATAFWFAAENETSGEPIAKILETYPELSGAVAVRQAMARDAQFRPDRGPDNRECLRLATGAICAMIDQGRLLFDDGAIETIKTLAIERHRERDREH